MRRWFAIFLIAFLPVQFTWAAVVDHHAHVHAAGHAGHHDAGLHDHGAEATAEHASHLGCDHCHGHCVGLFGTVPTSPARASGGTPAAPDDAPRAGHAPAQPERPQWARLA